MASANVPIKDRRSNMVTSSVNQPPKKSGAGGAYTWGSATDVTDYDPVGLNGMSKVVTSTGPSPTMVQQPALQQRSVSITDNSQFPALGNNGAMPAPPQTQWGLVHGSATQPAAGVNGMAAPKVILGQDMMRAGVEPNSQHPRNAFVKKAHKQPESTIVQQGTGAIDWTASGTTAFQQQVMQTFANNPAHLSPYVTQAGQPSLTSLKMAPTPAVSAPAPKLMKNTNPMKQFGKPQMVCQRKC
jgi:hypothetical protein